MKKLAIAAILSLAAVSLFAHDHGKSCDMGGKDIAVTGKVMCSGNDDCTFRTADAKTTYTVCEMSHADLPKLSAAGTTISVKGKLITCEGKEKLRIEQVGD